MELFTVVDLERIAAAAARDGQSPVEWLRTIVLERLDAEELEDALVGAHFTVATRTAAGL
ncbi:hypothetical protein J7E87_34500 [Streptomyces sp. ISL-1]|uniref:hypothetical protein n=1 Tax=Streptomyces sp. ISL-1 TaxID=2817657 RepID=UPI001BE8505B|nr:hypothetical protein [Streptomyces sp. ISL-1]MBT2394375.1 hypothetical protein [Streptomyces sp. ISL-1]